MEKVVAELKQLAINKDGGASLHTVECAFPSITIPALSGVPVQPLPGSTGVPRSMTRICYKAGTYIGGSITDISDRSGTEAILMSRALPHGWGRYEYINGGVYEGVHKFGNRDGPGFQYIPMESGKRGEAYIGNFADDLRAGNGSIICRNGDTYAGTFSSNEVTGTGRLYIHRTGEVYIGEVVNYYRHGYGISLHINGDIYMGEWHKDRMHGSVTYHSATTGLRELRQYEDGDHVHTTTRRKSRHRDRKDVSLVSA
jgi:hypothetical protein